MKFRNVVQKYGRPALVGATMSAPAVFAQSGAAQPDASAATAYIAAGVATVLAVFVAKYGVKGAILLARWVQGVVGR